MIDGYVTNFYEDTNESNYYHGKLYLELRGENVNEENTFKLYFDTNDNYGGVIGKDLSGNLLDGSRLGLTFDKDNPIIFHFYDEKKATSSNTKVNGVVLDDGMVIDSNKKAVTDPSVAFDNYVLDSSSADMELPQESIATLELNKTYEVDIYYYLEGCDADCTDSISFNEAEIHLAFYAIADE